MGAAVAWLRNAVDNAAEAHAALAAQGIDATLLHARFAMGDAQVIERDVLRRFGKGSARRAGAVMATQVPEQRLDLDFDLMVTDLAPMDLLIQRASRVWRHVRSPAERPIEGPRLLVLSPEPVGAPPSDWLGPELRRTGRVYESHALLSRSALVLFAAREILAPGDVRRLVETAYAPGEEMPHGLQRSSQQAEGKASADISVARQNLLKWRECYSAARTELASDIRTPTRLGEPSVDFRLARWVEGRLRPWYERAGPTRAWALSEVALPPWVATGVPQPEPQLRAAEEAARQGWDAWSRNIPILALAPGEFGWCGSVLRTERAVRVSCTSRGRLRAC